MVSKFDFDLVIKIRQEFFKAYQYFLRYSCVLDKWRNEFRDPLKELLFETLTKILEIEDDAAGFLNCSSFGLRPTLKLPYHYLLRINSHFTWQKTTCESNHRDKHYFLFYTEDDAERFYSESNASYIESVLGKFVRPIETATTHFFVVLYSKNPEVLLSICRVQIKNDIFALKEYFRNKIASAEIL